jgi:hypothetical protein
MATATGGAASAIGHDGRVPLTRCTDLSAASWLVDGDLPWQRLVTFGPAGFPAYARLRFLPDPAYPGQSEADAALDADAPPETGQLRALLDTLARFTSSPDDCYFCLWDGWFSEFTGSTGVTAVHQVSGTARPGLWTEPVPRHRVPAQPKVRLPHRAYYLFQGMLSDFGDWGADESLPDVTSQHVPYPAFIWPSDHRWCVAKDVDPHWAGVAAELAAIDRLLADPRLDVVPAAPDEVPPRYS